MRHVAMFSRPVIAALLAIAMTGCGGPTSARPGEIKNQCRGDSFRVDLADLMNARPDGPPDERVEQLRDWIWPVLLGRLEATTELRGLLVAVAPQPLVRDDALAHVLDQPVGSTRSVTAMSGDVVVMVESGAPTVMHEAILEAIDQESLHQAATPPRAVVYRYAIDEGKRYADMCRLDTFDAAWIESQREGFRRATLRTTGDLEAFLHGGVDLLTAQCTADGLKVTGRGRSRAGKAPITVEHVAALYRPRKIDYVPTAKLGVSGDGLRDKFEDWFALAKLAIDHPGVLGDRESELGEEWATMRDEILAWKKAFPRVETEELLLSWKMQREDPGFSLDPKIRPRDAARSAQAMLAALDDPRRMAGLLYSWNVSPRDATSFVSRLGGDGDRAGLRQGLVAVRDSVISSSDDEALGIINRTKGLSGSTDLELIANTAWFMNEHDGYQCARYDGYLRGTQVGMTMFYTDLLMKLWSDDYNNSAPEDLIPGFRSVVGHELSGAYCTEKQNRVRTTRAWLGLREEQYARETKERVRFAPIATRMFARTSAYGAGYSEEGEVDAENRRFYNWWNARYGRVAEWEPQYELLNQIMKWSVVAQVAALSEHESCLGFLDHVPVGRDHRFDKWVAAGKDLRWRGPVSQVHAQDEPTECLPLIRSRSYTRCGEETYWVGGVTAAQKAQVAAKPLRRLERARSLGRIDSRSAEPPAVASDGRVTYEAVTKADGELKQVTIDPAKRTFTAQVDQAQSQRGAGHSWSEGGEARPVTSVNKSWNFERGKLAGRDQFNGFGVAQLEGGDVAAAVVKPRITELSVAWVSRISEEAATRIDDGKTRLADVVAALPEVKEAWKSNADTVLVKIPDASGPPKYGLMTSGPGNRGPPDSLIGRFGAASPTGSGKAVETVLFHEADVKPLLRDGSFTPIANSNIGGLRSQLDDALAAGDTARSRQLMSELRARDPMGQKSIQDAITAAWREAARAGKDTRWHDNLSILTNIQLDRPTQPVREQNVLPADGTDFYVPRSQAAQYSEHAALPPGTSPVTGPGTARESFHAHIVEEAPEPERLPAVVPVEGKEWVHVKRPGARRSMTRPRIYIVYPCQAPEDDPSDTGVPCHGRSTARKDEQSYRQDLLRQACSLGDKQARALGVNDCGALRSKP